MKQNSIPSAGTKAEQRADVKDNNVSPFFANTNVVRRLNVVFLDIDGVLNTPQNACKRYEGWKIGTDKSRDEFGQLFCPKACLNLEYLCHTAEAKVVVSSTWRRAGLTKMQTMFQMRGIDIDVIDITPDFRQRGLIQRGEEIEAWLKENNVDNYVIIDDDTDFLPEQLNNFVNTDFEDGFNWRCMVNALKILMSK